MGIRCCSVLEGFQLVESVYSLVPTGRHGSIGAQGSALTCPWRQVEPAEEEEEESSRLDGELRG